MPWIVKPCEYCKNDFRSQTWVGHERKFCCNRCRQKYLTENNPDKFPWLKNGKRISQCRECGKDYWQRHTDKYFCNNECYLTWKRRNAEKECIVCFKKYMNKKHSYPGILHLCSKECRLALGNSHKIRTTSFSENPNVWLGPDRKKFAEDKLGNTCEKCGACETKNDIHHLDGNPKYNPLDGSNWMMLCRKCHLWIHREGRKCGHYLTRQEALDKPYEPYKRIRKRISNG